MAETNPELEQAGRQLERWIEDADEPGCPYPKCTFQIPPQPSDWVLRKTAVTLEPTHQTWAVPLGLPTRVYHIEMSNEEHEAMEWDGHTGEGLIMVDWIFRSNDGNPPHVSECTQAVYQMDYPIDSLRYIVFTKIIESCTVPCVRQVYASRGMMQYPPPSAEPQTWTPPSPEYYALLGTKIGSIAAALVLGAWGQGRRRIARIVTFQPELTHNIDMRFDIEEI
ncbi:hypothetical protein N7457_003553 [Penicillium paradoxum]|uniref:uncharacterized protein n=1 Tax=Penicillium paradoxum TaxID=176176 RepID=UPI002548DB8A|nr:uncharacterized protein N7457_003553 [Penicillium paradoxum]KAJ5788563.1 hypothetical protein N7457_003553 [Penicillium paradoxum]